MKHFSNRALACLALSLFAKLLYANDGGFYIFLGISFKINSPDL